MTDKPLQVVGTLTSISFTADGGLRLTFLTNELNEEEKLTASKYHQKFGHVLFRSNAFTTADVPKADAEDRRKTPSARLRSSLFKLWKLLEEPTGDFEVWYRKQMEEIITRIHGQIDLTQDAQQEED